MKKFLLITVAATILIIVGGILIFSKGPKTNPQPLPSNLEYFWGDGCPHCKNVEDFMNTWNKKESVKIDKFEVWNSPENAAILKARYEYCKIPVSEMGVPLLFTPEGKCYSGDTPIIDYLKTL